MRPDDADVGNDQENPDMVFGRPPTRLEPSESGEADLDGDLDADADADADVDADVERELADTGPVVTEPTVDDSETVDLREPAPDLPAIGGVGDGPVTGSARGPITGPLLGDADHLRERWEAVQVGFVDDPQAAVAAADEMVSAAVAEIRAVLDGERDALAAPWRDDPTPSTDALLQAFHEYRVLFERVLSV